MPVGTPTTLSDTVLGFPHWFVEFLQYWPSLEVAPYCNSRSSAPKMQWIQAKKAYYFDALPPQFGDLSTKEQQTTFRVTIRQFMERMGWSQEFYQISLVPLTNDNYRVSGTPRCAFILKTRDINRGGFPPPALGRVEHVQLPNSQVPFGPKMAMTAHAVG